MVHLCREEKNVVYLVTAVDRATRCILSWAVLAQRSVAPMQAVIDRAWGAKHYYSDNFSTYATLVYPEGATYHAMLDKSQTYTVESVNADLRHFLARLARHSRCFSRRLAALERALRLFVHYFNLQQLYRHAFPRYPRPLSQFVSIL